MDEFQTFRSAFNGFRREDVVRYIEYMNNKHNAQVEQLNTQLQTAYAELAQLKATPNRENELLEQINSLQTRCDELENALKTGASMPLQPEDELEAYRRAERTERMARERSAQIYAQANAVLSEATVKVEDAAAQINQVIDQVTAQMQQAQESVIGTKSILQDAAATLYAIKPEEQ